MATAARFLVLWSRPDDPASFERHYREVHIPLTLKLPGLLRYTLSRNIAPIRGDDPYYLVGVLDFDDLSSLQARSSPPRGVSPRATSPSWPKNATVKSMIYELEELLV